MPEYLAPGVFVEEVSFTPPQIRPASTSVAGMVGPTRTGPVRGRPQLLTSFNDYVTYFGDAENLTLGGIGVTNYTAYAARAFFDNGGQQLYLARIGNDVQRAGPASARPATASLAVPATGTALINLAARFPGSGGNVDVVFAPRYGQPLLQFRAPTAADTVVLRLGTVPANALVGSLLPASAFPLQSLTAVATLTPPPPTDTDAHSDPDRNTNPHRNTDPDRNGDTDAHSDRNAGTDANTDLGAGAVHFRNRPAGGLRRSSRHQPHRSADRLRHRDPRAVGRCRHGAGSNRTAASGRWRRTDVFDPCRRQYADDLCPADTHKQALCHCCEQHGFVDQGFEPRPQRGYDSAAAGAHDGQPRR